MSFRTGLAWKGGVGGNQLVLIPPAWIHRSVPTRSLLAEGLPIEPSLVEAWGLRPGDFVDIEIDTAQLASINRVNGLGTANDVKVRPDFMAHFVGEHRLQFPRLELPIDVTGDVGMRIWRALAPLGLGSEVIIDGPASSGKSWTSQTLACSLLTCALQGQVLTASNSAFVFLAIGERPPDVEKLKGIIGWTFGETLGVDPVSAGADPFPGVHRELYFGFTTDEAVLNAQIALERARRLVEMGKHVLFFIDSIWGLVLTLGGSLNGSGGGLAAAGVPREALKFVKDNFLFAGAVPGGGSMTPVITCLWEGQKTSSDTVLNEIGAPSATARWRHRLEMDTTTARPWIDLTVTGTRELESMFDGPRLALHREIQRRFLRDAGGPAERLAYLRRLFTGTSFGALQAKWAAEKTTATPEDTVSSSVAFLTGKAVEVLGRITNPAKAAAAVLEMIRTGRSLADSVVAVEWLFEALSEPEREAFFALLAKAELMPLAPSTPAGDPLENFVSSADALRNSGGDLHSALKQALARMGLTPEQLVESLPSDPTAPFERMKAILEAVTQTTGRNFKKKERRAKELLDKGFAPPADFDNLDGCEVYQRLTAKDARGWKETMENLLDSGPNSGPKKR